MTLLPRKRSPAIPEEIRTDVYQTLRRLLGEWRDDPDRLAVVAAAYSLGGWNRPDWEIEDHPPSLPREEGEERLRAALRRRNFRTLRNRGEGFLLAVEALARDVGARRLHEIQVEAAVIECRTLSLDERLAVLRGREETE